MWTWFSKGLPSLYIHQLPITKVMVIIKLGKEGLILTAPKLGCKHQLYCGICGWIRFGSCWRCFGSYWRCFGGFNLIILDTTESTGSDAHFQWKFYWSPESPQTWSLTAQHQQWCQCHSTTQWHTFLNLYHQVLTQTSYKRSVSGETSFMCCRVPTSCFSHEHWKAAGDEVNN